jgi:error-prone DNA polymerase
MGFYAPAQLVADARKRGVHVLPADVNHSRWDCTLEPIPAAHRSSEASGDRWALRLGLRMIRGLPERDAARIESARQREGGFADCEDLTRRTGLGRPVLSLLADADALSSLARDRRAALWETLGQERSRREMPLLEGVGSDQADDDWNQLEPLSGWEEVYADYNATGLSLRGHPIAFCRAALEELRCVRAEQLAGLRHGRPVRVAGLVLLRQRPSTAKGITFVTLEDETGSMNLVLHPGTWQRYFTVARASNAWLVDGTLENRGGVIHVVVVRLADLSEQVPGLELKSRDFH